MGIDAVLNGYREASRRPGRIVELERRILASCTPAQVPFVTDPHRKLALLTPRRAGKTSAVLRRFALGALRRKRARYLYFALSRPHAEELLWDPLKEFVHQFEIPHKPYESSLTMEFLDTGSTLQLVGSDDKKEADKKRGQKYDGAAVDESASFPGKLLTYLLSEVLRWALTDNRGWLAMVGTPGNTLAGPFYAATREGAEKTRPWEFRDSDEWREAVCTCSSADASCTAFAWSKHNWTLADNIAQPHIWLEALAEKEQEGWTDENPIWQREALGRWVADDTGRVYKYRRFLDDGSPWNTWTPLAKTADNPFGLPLGHLWRYVLGADLGSKKPQQELKEREQQKRMDALERNKTILELLAYSDTCRDLYHCHEVTRVMHVTALAEAIQELEAKTGGLDGVYVDVGYRSGGGMIIDELSSVHGCAAEAADKAKKPDAIELMNSDLVDGRMKVLPGSHLEAEMLTLQWDELQPERENKSQANDACDAAIYARRGALHHYSSEKAREEEPEQPRPKRVKALDSEQDVRLRRRLKKANDWFGETEPQPDEDMSGAGDWGDEGNLEA